MRVPGDRDHSFQTLVITHSRPSSTRYVLVDDVCGDLQGHPAVRILLHVLPGRRPGHVKILGRGDRVNQHRTGRIPLPDREGVVVSRLASRRLASSA